MDTTASDMGLDASGKKRARLSKWRRWFSRRPKQESTKTEAHEQPLSGPIPDSSVVGERGENATTPSQARIEHVNHSRVSPAISKDEREDSEANGGDAASSATGPDDAETEENDGEDDSEDNNQTDTEDEEVEDVDEDGDADAQTRPLRDFWAEAWNSDEVGEHRRALLEGRKEDQRPGQANSKKLVDGLIAKTPDKVATYTARWGSDVEKTALGKARSILVSALTVKDLIDAGLKFDPTGYGSAAWAVVSFGLTLVQNDKERVDLTFEACSHLADLMARYTRIEAHYWERKVKNGRPLEDAMIRVYTAILVYAAEVQGSIESSISTRIRKSFLSLTGQPLKDLRSTVHEENAKLEEWQRQIDRERGDDAIKKLKSIKKDTDYLLRQVDETAKNSYKALGKVNEEELRELYRFLIEKEGTSQAVIHKKLQREIDWWESTGDDKWKIEENKSKRKRASLVAMVGSSEDEEGQATEAGAVTEGDSSEDDDETQSDGLDDHPPPGGNLEHDQVQGDELGDWLLLRKEYLEWKKYPQGVLWLYGDSGCGKSALCSTIITKLNKAFVRDGSNTKVMAYWYFSSDLDETKRMDLLLVSLIRQLASKCQGFRDNKSLKWFRSHQDSGELPDDTNELFNYLKKFISKVDKDVFIVLDGLDQVPERQRAAKTGPLKLLDIIKKLTRQGYPNLHILLVSRDEKDIRLCLETNMKDMLVSVDVKQQLGADLDNFVERKLEDMPILKGNQPLRQAVKKRLNHGHDGNFLWAASVLSQVSQSLDAEEIRDVLNKIPDNIVGMYQTALEKVAAKDTKRMKLILLWMLRQQRPLSQAELAAAVGLHSPSVVTDICTKVLIQTSKQSVVVAGQERDLDVFRFTHFSVQEYLEAVFVGSQEKLGTKLEKVDRFRFPLPADAHIQLTRRCLAILSACFSSQKDKAAITDDGPGSDSDASASGLDTSHGDVTAASSDAEDTDYLYGDWGSYTSTSSSIADSKCTEGPARRYAAEYWFHHYNMVDKRKASSRQIKDLDAEICSQLLLDNKKLRFWLKTYDPEGGKDEDVPSPVYYVVKLGLEGILAQIITQFGRPRNDTVDRKPILDWRGSEGTALQLAAHLGDSDALDALIEHGADVNSEKGLHGTALYASAARGDENAVKQLVDAGAVCTGTEDGPLGNPLHIAAFRGHDTVIRLLLDRDRVAVDHRADPFCTALQAASAARKHTTVKLLLDHDADPNIVGGWLGTAAQAASTHLGWPGNDDIVETLVAKKADFVTGPSFWSTAYKRASFRDEMGQELISKSYHSLLLQYRIPNSAGLHELQHPQRLLAVAICQWTLPADRLVNSDPVFKGLLCRVPFQDQLDAIRQAIPRLELTMQHVRHKDFLHKALFWSGINYILNRLPLLINQCLGQVRRQLRYEPEESARVHASPALPLRWAFKEFEDGYEPCYQDAWPRRSLISGFRMRNRRKQWRSPWGEDSRDQMSSLARSDLIAVDLMHRRQRHRHLEEALLTTSGYIDPGESGESRESAAHKELQLASEPGVWVMSDILDLVKDLLVYGDRCVRYQDAVSDATETAALGHRKRIEDLTFELFSVVIRLAFLVGGRIEAVDLQLLPDPVRLLTAVRLKRIKQLDAMCEQDFASKSPCGRAPADNHAGLKAQEIAAAVARQVEQSIEGKLASSRADMVREIQSQVSGVVKEEVSRLVGQMQQGLEEKMDEMQRQLAEVQETQARRGLLW